MIDEEMEALISKYGYWGQHPKHPAIDWEIEVMNRDTRCGYWEWVMVMLDEEEDK